MSIEDSMSAWFHSTGSALCAAEDSVSIVRDTTPVYNMLDNTLY